MEAWQDSNKVESRAFQKIIIAGVLSLFCAGCISTSGVGPAKNGDSKRSNFSYEEENGSNRPPILHTGSKFIYQDIRLSDGEISRVSMEVKEKKEFEHKQAYWVEVTGHEMDYFSIYDMNLNWIGLFGEGRKLESVEPCLQIFKWPLRVGKKWDGKYTYRDSSDHSSGVYLHDSKINVNIRTYEEVRVPAGTFKALRIQANNETLWYAPSVGWVVKEELNLNSEKRWIFELVEYSIPKSTQNHFHRQL